MIKHKTISAAVNTRRAFYSMATIDGRKAEILFYGEIVKTRPMDSQTGKLIPGNFIMLDEFLEDLESLTFAEHITVRINSLDGNPATAITIYNRLKELKAEKIAIVDGIAMSGGSLIMCAGDKVKVNPSSQVMLHKCWTFLDGVYNADQLMDIIKDLDVVDKAQAAIYRRKTGFNEDAILSMMSKPTYFVGQEIVDVGLADEVQDSKKI